MILTALCIVAAMAVWAMPEDAEARLWRAFRTGGDRRLRQVVKRLCRMIEAHSAVIWSARRAPDLMIRLAETGKDGEDASPYLERSEALDMAEKTIRPNPRQTSLVLMRQGRVAGLLSLWGPTTEQAEILRRRAMPFTETLGAMAAQEISRLEAEAEKLGAESCAAFWRGCAVSGPVRGLQDAASALNIRTLSASGQFGRLRSGPERGDALQAERKGVTIRACGNSLDPRIMPSLARLAEEISRLPSLEKAPPRCLVHIEETKGDANALKEALPALRKELPKGGRLTPPRGASVCALFADDNPAAIEEWTTRVAAIGALSGAALRARHGLVEAPAPANPFAPSEKIAA